MVALKKKETVFFVVGYGAAKRWLDPLILHLRKLTAEEAVPSCVFALVLVYAISAEWLGSVAGITGAYLLGYFFFQAEDGIRDIGVTGVQTCALPILDEFRHLEHGGEIRLWHLRHPCHQRFRPGWQVPGSQHRLRLRYGAGAGDQGARRDRQGVAAACRPGECREAQSL